jgi:maltose alpha-D-glucosyltransferase/alpha-amylase
MTRREWWKDGVIYQLHVKTFCDGNGDGIGDFVGLTSRLDHLRELGVATVWLLPFYPSPLRDDGYDIADYRGVHPSYGTMRDFKRFLRAAQGRGLRVITELVMNHTSDQHPWFQRARRSPPGSRQRDYFVWSDTPDRYREARVIFQDFESSNWSWDPLAGAYYWHRFYSHQPDLNYENPLVREEMMAVLDHWLDLGVDGVRLDAVPYLFEAEGTNCENLPATHALLRDLRRHIDQRYGDRMLLAEANQWPEDAAAYFGAGDGDECHMAFHFPLMPRLYMAVQREDRRPVIDILEQTPAIPSSAQWAIFLRNHDELTLEMVTDEERDYMYRAYADEQQMRVNLGIRRRLAPLLGNDRRKIELLNALLFSLPGTPIIYYGDEIGMGDNVYLGDRDGVRTPMQWSPDRNAGFSTASPQRLYLPVITEPAYHYETVNVEAQERNASSLLWWMRQLVVLRTQHPVLARGGLTTIEPDNHRVLAFVRTDAEGGRHVLVVANLSRHAQPVALDLAAFGGHQLTELFGGARFASVHEQPVFLTLGPYAFYWFTLQRAEHVGETDGDDAVPTLAVEPDWAEVLGGRAARRGVHAALRRFLVRQRWFAGKDRHVRGLNVIDVLPLGRAGRPTAALAVVRVEFADGDPETYCVPLVVVRGDRAAEVAAARPGSLLARLVRSDGHEIGVVVDGLADADTVATIVRLFARVPALPGSHGRLTAQARPELRRLARGGVDVRMPRLEQSNTTVVLGDEVVVKVQRRLSRGVSPDVEVGEYLAARRFPYAPALLGALTHRMGTHERTLAVAHHFVPHETDAWTHTLDVLGLAYEELLSSGPPGAPLSTSAPLELVGKEPPASLLWLPGSTLDEAARLGTRVGELHLCLAEGTDRAFTPEPLTKLVRRSLYQSFRDHTAGTVSALRRALPSLPPERADAAGRVVASHGRLLDGFARIKDADLDAWRSRVHGDLHLGQVLWTGRDFVIIDFEGEPVRSTAERRLKHPPVRDVAGMLRSYHYAATTALDDVVRRGIVGEAGSAPLAAWARAWETWAAARFLTGYLAVTSDTHLVPDDVDDRAWLLDIYVLDKLLYEVRYELATRPALVWIPLRRVLEWLDRP